MSVTTVLPAAVTVFDRLAAARLSGQTAKSGDYASSDPAAVTAALPNAALSEQLIELTTKTPGNVGQVRAVRIQYEQILALGRAEALRRASPTRLRLAGASRRLNGTKGIRLPIEVAQTLFRVST